MEQHSFKIGDLHALKQLSLKQGVAFMEPTSDSQEEKG